MCDSINDYYAYDDYLCNLLAKNDDYFEFYPQEWKDQQLQDLCILEFDKDKYDFCIEETKKSFNLDEFKRSLSENQDSPARLLQNATSKGGVKQPKREL